MLWRSVSHRNQERPLSRLTSEISHGRTQSCTLTHAIAHNPLDRSHDSPGGDKERGNYFSPKKIKNGNIDVANIATCPYSLRNNKHIQTGKCMRWTHVFRRGWMEAIALTFTDANLMSLRKEKHTGHQTQTDSQSLTAQTMGSYSDLGSDCYTYLHWNHILRNVTHL